LSFSESTPISKNALCHCCYFFPLFLVHVIVFCKINCVSLVRPPQTL
jgi:hypothetical protein